MAVYAAGFLSLPEIVMTPPTFMPGAIPICREPFQFAGCYSNLLDITSICWALLLFVGRRVSIEKNLAARSTFFQKRDSVQAIFLYRYFFCFKSVKKQEKGIPGRQKISIDRAGATSGSKETEPEPVRKGRADYGAGAVKLQL